MREAFPSGLVITRHFLFLYFLRVHTQQVYTVFSKTQDWKKQQKLLMANFRRPACDNDRLKRKQQTAIPVRDVV